MLDFCVICVCVCVRIYVLACTYVCVCAHMLLGVSKHVRGLPTKYSPLYFLSKTLLVDSIDIANTLS